MIDYFFISDKVIEMRSVPLQRNFLKDRDMLYHTIALASY